MSKSLYSGVNKVYFRSYLLLNIVASSAYMFKINATCLNVLTVTGIAVTVFQVQLNEFLVHI
jgi:hypothetical protein